MGITHCMACGSNNWFKLPDPVADKSVTTSGCIVDESLGKSHCVECGLVQRTEHRFLGLTDFYENRYSTYYERPGTEQFNESRYSEIARWVSFSFKDIIPNSVIEVGCGRGWTLNEMRKIYPNAIIEGIDPSIENSEEARKRGFHVYTGKLDSDSLPDRKYDLVFSNHVLQHTTDPIDFLKVMGQIVSERGVIVITVQDSSTTSNELMYSDQNFSFLPEHLVKLAEKSRLKVLSWLKAPDTDGLRFSQMLVCCNNSGHNRMYNGDKIPTLEGEFLDQLLKKRVQYFEAWPRLSEFLCWKSRNKRDVFNFGAGMYSYLLACYCEEYWKRVTACTIDNMSGVFAGKRVLPFETIQYDGNSCFVLGTRPCIQRMLATKIANIGLEAVCWDNFIDG